MQYLWVDPICINQDDPEEKADQVTKMSRIFEGAQRVIIYLGPDHDGHGPDAKGLLDDVRSMLNGEIANIDTSEWNSMPYPDRHDPILSDARWSSILALLKQDWFSRGWVIQEAALARLALIIWGSTGIPWDNVMWTGLLIYNRARSLIDLDLSAANLRFLILHMDAFSERRIDSWQVFYSKAIFRMAGLLDYVHCGRALQFTDCRDRIYAFLDLSLLPEQNVGMVPDYEKSTLDVFRDFALRYMRTTNSLQLLSYVLHSAQTLQSFLPTWVPHWDSGTPIVFDMFFGREGRRTDLTSRHGKTYAPEVIEGEVLKVRGVVVDTVRFTSDVLDQSVVTPKSLFELYQAVELSALVNPYGHHCTLAFVEALCHCRYDGDWETWDLRRGHLVDVLKNHAIPTESFECNGDNERRKGLDSLMAFIAISIHGMKFMITERGYMGMAPAVTEEKDLCAILFGNQHQFMLRPAGNEPTSMYQMLGPCFILGAKMTSGRLGSKYSKDWADWDIEEQDIQLC